MTTTFQLSTKPSRDRDEPAILVVKLEAPDNVSAEIVYGRFVEMVAEAGLQGELERFSAANNAAPAPVSTVGDPLAAAQATVRNTFPNAQPVQPQVPGAVGAPMCQHGQKTLLSKTSEKTGKPWKAWACPADRNDPTKCDLDFIR
jgi:hypothetical protein